MTCMDVTERLLRIAKEVDGQEAKNRFRVHHAAGQLRERLLEGDRHGATVAATLLCNAEYHWLGECEHWGRLVDELIEADLIDDEDPNLIG